MERDALGPHGHHWCDERWAAQPLDLRGVQPLLPGTAWPQIGKRVLAVVILQAPVQIHMTFGLTILLAGGTLLEVTKKLREDFLKTWAINNCFWPPVLAVNMKFVALNNQAVVGGVGHAFWNVFLAYMANRSTISPHEGEATAVADATAALAQASKN